MDYLQNYINNLALEKYKKGQGSGPLSKIISLISLHSLVLLIAVLLIEKQFIPLAIILISSLTPLGVWVSIGFLIYFVVVKFWIGVVLISLYGFLAWFSSWFGIRNIKKNLFADKSTIDPFEGIFELKFLTIAILILFGLALVFDGFISVISWIFYSILTFYLLIRLTGRIKTKWSQIHYSLMIRYASFAGAESSKSSSEGREFNIENPLVEVIQSAFTNMDLTKATELFNQAKFKLDKFEDKFKIENYFKKKNPIVDPISVNSVLSRMEQLIKVNYNKLLVNYVIAEIVYKDFGDDERIKYLVDSFTGKAI